MTNSLIIFFAALLFLVFGYASIIRIAYRSYFSNSKGTQSETLTYLSNLIYGVGQGAIFTCLIASSLLLFWGWGIALLWLLTFHLLAETAFNFQASTASFDSVKKQPSLAPSALRSIIVELIWGVYVLLLSTIVVALLVNLINQQTGLVFALIALFPAHLLMRNANTGDITGLGIGISVAALLLGLLFAHQLGISIFGGFNPIEKLGFPELANGWFAWLQFDNTSIMSIALIISGLVLSGQAKFRSDLSYFCGFLICVVLVLLLVKLAWLRPLIDAPLNSTQVREPGLPAFSSLGLFIFAGLSVLLLRENKDTQKKMIYKKITDGLDGKEDAGPTNFVNLQLSSLTSLLFSMMVLLMLACAMGIGAWNTHYLDWNAADSIAAHFNLAMESLLALLALSAGSGSFAYSLFVCGLAYVGFALLLNVIARLANPRGGSSNTDKRQNNSILGQLHQTKVIPAILIYLISSYLIQRGISMQLWILVGMLAWFLVTDRLIENTLSYVDNNPKNKRNQKSQSVVSLLFLVLGALQIGLTALRWFDEDQVIFACVAVVILVLAVAAWKNAPVPLIAVFKDHKAPELFT
ncbi:MAG: hypothetical protein KTR16_06290 [Acidiferrobacterales bacterium]|nr:hypothetical protein [Acidiferrobacterales bacterium]